jgi:hypothetical protein
MTEAPMQINGIDLNEEESRLVRVAVGLFSIDLKCHPQNAIFPQHLDVLKRVNRILHAHVKPVGA